MAKKTKQRMQPDLVGVEVMPLSEYLAALDLAVIRTRDAVAAGQMPCDADIPSRMQPVLRDGRGRHVVARPTERGVVYKRHRVGRSVDLMQGGATTGGFLDLRDVPPIAPGGGSSPARWTQEYVDALPKHQALNQREHQWQGKTQNVRKCVRSKKRTSDEWRQSYFGAIRDAQRQRFAVTRSSNAGAHPRSVQQSDSWKEDEYHESFFQQLQANTQALQRASRAEQQAVPADGLAAAQAPGIANMLHRAKKRVTGDVGDLLLQSVQQGASPALQQMLEKFVTKRANALTGRGGPLKSLRDAFEVIDQLNDTGAIDLLAGLADSAIFPKGPDGNPNPVDLDLLKKQFGEKFAAAAVGRGVEELLGRETADALQKAGVTAALTDAAKAAMLGKGTDLTAAVDDLMDGLPGAAVDQALDRLIGAVDDRSSIAKQVANKYKAELKSVLTDALSADGRDGLVEKFDAMFNGISSSACVPFGLANPGDGADIVHVNGLPATRLNDDCDMPSAPDKGKFFQGNPTILVNGSPPAGAIHAAIGAKGTIATPLVLSSDVFMGATTVSVAIQVQTEAPQGAAAGVDAAGGASDAAGEGAAESGEGKPPLPEDERQRVLALQREEGRLNHERQELTARRGRGEISEEEYSRELARLQSETESIARERHEILAKYDTEGLLDSDDYLFDPEEKDREQQRRAEQARKLRADARRWGGLANLAALAGQDQVSDRYGAMADSARLAAAQLEGGDEAFRREAEQIAARKTVEAVIDRIADRVPPGPVKKVVDWAVLPIADGLGQLTEEWIKSRQGSDDKASESDATGGGGGW